MVRKSGAISSRHVRFDRWHSMAAEHPINRQQRRKAERGSRPATAVEAGIRAMNAECGVALIVQVVRPLEAMALIAQACSGDIQADAVLNAFMQVLRRVEDAPRLKPASNNSAQHLTEAGFPAAAVPRSMASPPAAPYSLSPAHAPDGSRSWKRKRRAALLERTSHIGSLDIPSSSGRSSVPIMGQKPRRRYRPALPVVATRSRHAGDRGAALSGWVRPS